MGIGGRRVDMVGVFTKPAACLGPIAARCDAAFDDGRWQEIP